MYNILGDQGINISEKFSQLLDVTDSYRGLLGTFHWENNIGIEKDRRYKKNWEEGKISKSDQGFRKFAKSIFPEIPIFVATSYGGCFAVKKNQSYNMIFFFIKDY